MTDASEVTVVELKRMCMEVLEMREICDQAHTIYKDLNKKCEDHEMKLIEVMEKLDMKSFKEAGMNFIRTEKESITIPKGDDKDLFFDYLKKLGHFDALATVNSQTLNSWYKSENALAKERGEPYATIPGLEIPSVRIGLTVRKA